MYLSISSLGKCLLRGRKAGGKGACECRLDVASHAPSAQNQAGSAGQGLHTAASPANPKAEAWHAVPVLDFMKLEVNTDPTSTSSDLSPRAAGTAGFPDPRHAAPHRLRQSHRLPCLMNRGVNTASISRSRERSTLRWVTPARLRRWLVSEARTGSNRRRRVAGRPVVRAARPTAVDGGGSLGGGCWQVGNWAGGAATCRHHVQLARQPAPNSALPRLPANPAPLPCPRPGPPTTPT